MCLCHCWNDFFLTMQVQDKEYINEDTFRSIARHFVDWQKEQLMAKAIDGEVGYWNLRGLSINTDLPRSVSEGDVVKIITIKEE